MGDRLGNGEVACVYKGRASAMERLCVEWVMELRESRPSGWKTLGGRLDVDVDGCGVYLSVYSGWGTVE